MKKFVYAILLILAICIIGFIGYRIWLSYMPGSEEEKLSDINYLNNSVDFKMYLFGDDIDFYKELKYEKIDKLDFSAISGKHDYVYLIINDLSAANNLTYKQLDQILKYADKNTNFNVYYIGKSLINEIKENFSDCNLDDSDLSFGYVLYEGERIQHYGVWKTDYTKYLKENKYILGENICDTIKQLIKSNE